MTDPIGRVTTYGSDIVGRQTSVANTFGTTTYAYDQVGNTLSTTRSGIGTSSSTYDTLGRVATATDWRGKTTTFSYDLVGNVLSTTSPLGNKKTSTYDSADRPLTVVDPRGNVTGANPVLFTTTFTYDAAGNPLTVRNGLNQTTTSTFDRVGNLATVTDPKNNTTTYSYDNADRVVGVSAPGQGTTAYNYVAGRMRSRVDAKTHSTTYDYDLSGRLTRRTDPLGRFFTFGYDPAGNQTTTIDAIANAAGNPALGTTTLSIDPVGRVTGRDYSPAATPDVTYTYDPVGRLGSMTDGAGTETYTYDPANRLATVTRGTQTFTYGYDPNSNVTTRTPPGSTAVSYGIDDDNRLATVTEGANTTTYTYDPASNLTLTSLPNGVTRTATYDGASRTATLTTAKGATAIAGFNYTRDANGLPTQIAATGANMLTRQFTYDTANRLLTTCYQSGNCNNNTKTTWTYDLVGNRLTEKISAAAQTGYSYDNADQLTAITGPGAATLTYDTNGNTVTHATRTYTYNAAHQTTSIQDGTNPATTYTYDGNNNRRTTTTGTAVTASAWDINASLPLLAVETDGGGSLLRRYTHGIDPISYTTPTSTDYYLTDELGSATHTTSTTGTARWAYTYTPWGDTKTTTKIDPTAPDNPIRYTAQYLDPTTNLYNLRARLYNPAQGRFTQTDQMPLGPGSAVESTYVYAGNNPTVYIDPSGLRLTKSVNLRKFAPLQGPCNIGVPFDPEDQNGQPQFDVPLYLGVRLDCKSSAPVRITTRQNCLAGTTTGLNVSKPVVFQMNIGTWGAVRTSGIGFGGGTGNTGLICNTSGVSNQEDPSNDDAPPVPGGGTRKRRPSAVAKSIQEAADGSAGASVEAPYKRPSGTPTRLQRASVQGKPCVDCGETSPVQRADHKTLLVREYYETGKIDVEKSRQLEAVQPQCPACSNRQGAELAKYSKAQKKALGL